HSYMKIIRFFIFFNLLAFSAIGQRIHVGVFGGLAAYTGDLVDKIYPKKVTNGAIGITINYELTDQFIIRGGFTYAVVGGADRFSDQTDAQLRNLSFETSIAEFSVVGEYYLQNLYESRFSPYAFAGLAMYHYNPYAYNSNSQKTFLKPLSTEGQGISGYPDRQPYSLTQFAIPFGGGIKFAITENLRIGAEVGIRKLFTDYLDDVSKNYIDPNDLLAARGQEAVDMSYRGGEVTGGSLMYPDKTVQRGNPKTKDYYYFTGLHLTYKLGSGMGGGGNGRKSRTGCPTNVY
ncbi:MAG: DUF6089 family protein, partial [Chitinophagaceae bacterium]